MKIKLTFALVFCSLLSACSAPLKQAAAFDFSEKVCARDIQSVPTQAVARVPTDSAKISLVVDFQKAASCITAKDGKPIPLIILGLDGKVPSEIGFNIAIHRGSTFAAAIDVLDGEFKLLKSVPFEQFTRRGSSYTLSLFLNDSDAAARHLVLRPDSGTVGSADQSITGKRNETFIAVVAGSALYYGNFVTGSEVVTNTWHSEVGRLEVVLKDYQPTTLDR